MTTGLNRICFILPLLTALATSASAETNKPEQLTYEEHIRPIFRAHCYDCHGATKDLKGNLDLRLVRFLIKGGDSGESIVPGKPG